jgi:hypothetical protein
MLSSLRRIPLLFVIATLLAACPKAPQPMPQPQIHDGWVEAQAPGLRVLSSVGEADARRALRELHEFRAILSHSIDDDSAMEIADPGLPLHLYVLRSWQELRRFLPEEDTQDGIRLDGIFRPSPYSLDIFLVRGEVADKGEKLLPEGLVRHEYHHLVYRRIAPYAPLWLTEGLAEFWLGARVDRGEVVIGGFDDDYLGELTSGKTFAELIGNSEAKPYTDQESAFDFYAKSALLTHYLLLVRPEGEQGLEDFLAGIRAGKSGMDSAASVWGDVAALEREVHAYFESGTLRSTRQPLRSIPKAPDLEFQPASASRQRAIRAYTIAKAAPMSEMKRAFVDVLFNGGYVDVEELEASGGLLMEAMGTNARANDETEELCAILGRNLAKFREKMAARGKEVDLVAALGSMPDAGLATYHLFMTCSPRNAGGTFEDPELTRALVGAMRNIAPRFSLVLLLDAAVQSKSSPEDAQRLALEAMKRSPADVRVHLQAARVFRETGAPAEADTLAGAALDSARLLGGRFAGPACLAAMQTGFARLAGDVCTTAMEVMRGEPGMRSLRGMQRLLAGDRDGALVDLRVSKASTDPEVANGSRELIRLIEKSEPDDAVMEALHLRPNDLFDL